MGSATSKRGSSVATTPGGGRASKQASATTTPSSRASGVQKRKRGNASKAINYAEDSNELSGDESDYSAKDVLLKSTPSRKRSRPAQPAAPAGTTPIAIDDSTPKAAAVRHSAAGSYGSNGIFSSPTAAAAPATSRIDTQTNDVFGTASTSRTMPMSPQEVIDLSEEPPTYSSLASHAAAPKLKQEPQAQYQQPQAPLIDSSITDYDGTIPDVSYIEEAFSSHGHHQYAAGNQFEQSYLHQDGGGDDDGYDDGEC